MLSSTRRLIASTLAAVLILTAPGLPGYAAAASIVRGPSGSSTSPVARGVVTVSPRLPSFSQGAMLGGPSLSPSLTALGVTPSVTPQTGLVVNAQNLQAVTAQAAPIVTPSAHSLLSAPKAVPQATPEQSKKALETVEQAAADLGARRQDSSLTLSAVFDQTAPKSRFEDSVFGGATQSPSDTLGRNAPLETAVPVVPPSVTPSRGEDEGPRAPKGRGLWWVLGFGLAGAAAGFFGAPFAAAWLAGHSALAAGLGAFWLKAGVIALGALTGIAASQRDTWKGFFPALWTTTITGAGSTFRFWARFGRIFAAVLTGASMEEARNAPLPGNVFKYPVAAWLFVVIGYIGAAVGAGVAFLYKAVSTPVLAAFRGLKQLAFEFFPWLKDVLRFLRRIAEKVFPFIGGFIWGGFKAGGVAIAIGAVTTARPFFASVVAPRYESPSLLGWIGIRLLQVAAVVAGATAALVGGVTGLAASILYAPTYALMTALDWAKAKGKLSAALHAWIGAVEGEDGFQLLGEYDFAARPGQPSKTRLTLGEGLTRFFNIRFGTSYVAPVTGLLGVIVYVRSWLRASYFLKNGKYPEKPQAKPDSSAEQDSRPLLADKESAPAPQRAPRFWLPFLAGLLGAAAGAGIVGWFTLAPLALTFSALWPFAAAALLGSGLALAATRWDAWKGYFPKVAASAVGTASLSFLAWARLGLRTDAAFKDAPLDRALSAEAPLALSRYPFMAWPGVAAGYLAAGAGFVGGALYEAVAVPVGAAWTAFVEMVQSFWPALKRFLDAALRVVKRFFPFVFGFAWGALKGLAGSGAFFASVAGWPLSDIGGREIPEGSRWNFVGTWALRILGLPVGLVMLAGSFLFGLIPGLAVALPLGLSTGLRWAHAGGKSEEYLRRWEKRELDRAADELSPLGQGMADNKVPGRFWTTLAGGGNAVLSWIPNAFSALFAGIAALTRSFIRAQEEKPEDAPYRETESSAKPSAPAAQAPAAGQTPLWAVLTLGLLGAGGGTYAAFAFVVPALALTGWWAALGYTASILVLGALGLSFSQPAVWKGLLSSIKDNAADSVPETFGYWKRSGEAFAAATIGVPSAKDSKLSWGHVALGGLLTLPWTLAGGIFGALRIPAKAAVRAAEQIMTQFLPWLKQLTELAWRLVKRFGPFVFGLLVAGPLTGIVGAALFGALLLGRPYFQYVLSEDYQHKGIAGGLGFVALKAAALIGGVVLGAFGLFFGVLAALPYALTLSPATAFRWADVGGRSQKFFELWLRGTLRTEMKRVNMTTNSYDFKEPRQDGKLQLVDGWLRLGNIAAATIVGLFTTTVLGYVSYFRSIINAAKDLKAGVEPPSESGAGMGSDVSRAASKAAKNGGKWTGKLAGWAAGLGFLYLLIKSQASLTLFLWVLAAPVGGWLAGYLLGGLVGVTLGLIFWMSRQLEK